MKIICEYCDSSVDIKNNTKCPNCGADLSSNKFFRDSMNMKFEKEKIELEKEKLQLEKEKARYNINQPTAEQKEAFKSLSRFLKIGCSIPFIFVIFVIIFIIINIFNFTGSLIDATQTLSTAFSEESLVESQVEGNFNEPISTSTYSVTCNHYEEFEVPYSTPTVGHKYVRFHFIVENISNEDIYSDEKIRTIADGIQCQRMDYYKNVTELPVSYISPEAKIVGYIGFEIPENTKLLQIKYGDYVTINIDMNQK